MSVESVRASSPQSLAELVDKLCYEPDPIKTMHTVHALRRAALGRKPSEIFQSVRRQPTELRARLARLAQENRALEEDIERLRSKVAALEGTAAPSGERDYTYAEVMQYIARAFRKTSGALARWAAHSEQLHAADPSIPVVTESRLQGFRAENRFPGWAVEQLASIGEASDEDVPRHRWSEAEVLFLEKLYLEDPSRSNRELAERCTEAFNAPVRMSGVKSKLNFLRERGRIPPLRPQRIN